MTRFLAVAVCTLTLSACASEATARKEQQPIPPELLPQGYDASECHIADSGGAITETGPDGRPVTVGDRKPRVECVHHTEHITTTTTPTCHTESGKSLDLADCCMNPDA